MTACAQTNALLGTTTGSLSSSEYAAVAQSADGPPLPERREPGAQQADAGSGLLAALPDIDISAEAVAPASVVASEPPVNVYTRLARQIRRCWLAPTDPKLPGHGFRAKAEPGQSGAAEIDLYEEVPGRKYGPFAFEVKISPEGTGALVRSQNRRLDDELAEALRADIARWARGTSGCNGPRDTSA